MKKNIILLFLSLVVSYSQAKENKVDIYNCGNFENFKSKQFDIIFENALKKGQSMEPQPGPIHLEGNLYSSPQYIASTLNLKSIDLLLQNSLNWRVNKSNGSLIVAKKYLLSWAKHYVPSYNPIDEAKLDQYVQAYSLVSEDLSENENDVIKHFLAGIANGYIDLVDKNRDGAGWKSNWQSIRVKIVTSIAFALNDTKLKDDAKRIFIAQINNNIFNDASTWDFKERDAIYYVIADLRPLIESSIIARNSGSDWYRLKNEKSISLEMALKWLKPYVDGSKKHLEFKNSTVDFDRIRAKKGYKEFNGYFNPKLAGDLLWEQAILDHNIEKLASKIQINKPLYMIHCY